MTLAELIKAWMAGINGLQRAEKLDEWEPLMVRCSRLRRTIEAAAAQGVAREGDVTELFWQVTGVTLEGAGLK